MQYKSKKQKEALQKQGKYLQAFNEKSKVFKTEKDIQKAIEFYSSGMSLKQIAEYFKCSVFPVKKVLKAVPKRKPGEYPNHRSKHQSGENNSSWKGGTKSVYDRFRGLNEYWYWRKAVLERDNNCCTQCYAHEKLHAHHLKFLRFLIEDYCKVSDKLIKELTIEDLRNPFFYDVNNGLTLCETCHKKWHKLHGR